MDCCDGLTFVRTEGVQLTYDFPKSVDLTSWTAQMRIAASEGATVLLTVAGAVTAQRVSFTTAPGLSSIPNANPVSDPWVGVFEVDLTAPGGQVERLHHGSVAIEKGV